MFCTIKYSDTNSHLYKKCVPCSYPILPCSEDEREDFYVDEPDDMKEEEKEEEEEEEGEDCCVIDRELPLHVLPLYSMLPTEQQAKVCLGPVMITILKLVFSPSAHISMYLSGCLSIVCLSVCLSLMRCAASHWGARSLNSNKNV